MLDVFEILKEKIAAVPEGEHLVGLRAVQLHTETAIRHYNRGQAEQDGTAFTDAIYRCNQAFEGSAKEAYRVLAEKDPDGKSTYTIEEYLSKNSVLRQRVLSQFKNYRMEWRNPSTHNYKLDFDEDAALLAITSVTVFSIVLCDQITEKLAIAAAREQAPRPKFSTSLTETSSTHFLEAVAKVVATFASDFRSPDITPTMDSRLIFLTLASSLASYLTNSLPGLKVEIEKPIADGRVTADLFLTLNENIIIIEIGITRILRNLDIMVLRGEEKLSRYLLFIPTASGILFLFSTDNPAYEVTQSSPSLDEVRVVRPLEPKKKAKE